MTFDESNTRDWEEMAKYFANEMDAEELVKFQEKVDSTDKNKELLEQVKRDWKKMENYNKEQEFDANKAWNKLHSKFESEGLINETNSGQNKHNFKILYRIAAVLILGILLTSIVYYLSSDISKANWQVAETYKSNENLKVILPDGSIVYMNANSKLYYPEKFDGINRVVEFEGDAFFEITKNPKKPFIIKAKDSEIKVLGTSFNVNTNLVSKDVEVLVETGKVKLSSRENEQIAQILLPGDMGTMENKQVSFHKNSDKNYLSWKTKHFDFTEGIKLGEAIKMLNRAYHSNIKCNNAQICGNVLYSTFENESLNQILEIVCGTYSLKIVSKGDAIILTN